MATHCETTFSWTCNKSPTSITTYSFIDVSSAEIMHEDVEKDGSPRSLLERGESLNLSRNENTTDSRCLLRLSCPNPDIAKINGLTVISESRTLEISSDTKGYITTVQGKEVDTPNIQDREDTHSKLYFCKCYFDESHSDLSVKFLSLGERTSFCVLCLVINISQYCHSKGRGAFDVNRLKKDIDEMGGVLSDRAKDFMATMEQFEQNKLGAFEGIMSQQLNGPAGLASHGFSAIMNNILGADRKRALLEDSCNSSSENMRGDDDEEDIYKMLQSVCGSVTRMRTPKQENISGTSTSPDSGGAMSCTLSTDGDGEMERGIDMNLLTAVVEEKINQVKTELKTELQEAKQEMTQKIEDTRQELNHKLDKILVMLNSIQTRTDGL